MTVPRRLLIAALGIVASATTSRVAAQSPDTPASRWTLRVSPGVGVERGGVIGQTSAWLTWDRLALGVRRATATSFLAIFSPSYEVRERSALIGVASRKGHRTSLYAIGLSRTSGDGGYDDHCFIFSCGSAPANCLRGGDPSDYCVLTPHTGFAAAAEFGLHFRYIGFGTALTFVQTSQVRIAGFTVGLQVGNMPTPRQ